MLPNKTQPSPKSVSAYLAEIDNESRRVDAEELVKLMKQVTKTNPVMWGSSIVGFGTHHYKYETGREGDIAAVGFAARKQALAVYGLEKNKANITLAKQLGIPTDSKGCLYIKKLSEINLDVLGQMVANSFQHRNNS